MVDILGKNSFTYEITNLFVEYLLNLIAEGFSNITLLTLVSFARSSKYIEKSSILSKPLSPTYLSSSILLPSFLSFSKPQQKYATTP